ncbi:secreted RxLR effector protein 161-like [Lathyrus oleraceus]|uniref:secreted RxLR effector protein 161-like n=1 Tax=Pisum sativum TaxID=3888 RepID=UPI0021D29A95|nr:secreted RxLR effector protein 161-like [Pisum sativum]
MKHCDIAITPVEPRLHLGKSEHEHDVNPTQCRRLIGFEHYLCNMRHNLDSSVRIVRRFMERPKVSHLKAVKRIIRYIKGSIGCKILFPTTDKGIKYNLLGYTDSNWCGDKDDIKSTVGYIFMFGETPILWCSKKESVVTLSSHEAKYIATSLYVSQAAWLMNLLKELYSEEGEVITLMVDNIPL